MENILFFCLFMILWACFCKFALYIFSKICYHVVIFGINIGNDGLQRRISKVLGG